MSQSITYNFPRTTYVTSNSVQEQLRHVLSEMDEVQRAIDGNEGPERVDEELVDVFHSLETLFRRMQIDLGDEYVEELFQQVEEKNQARGYYVEKTDLF